MLSNVLVGRVIIIFTIYCIYLLHMFTVYIYSVCVYTHRHYYTSQNESHNLMDVEIK